MKKVMIMASMLAMVMLAASPAMAQNVQNSEQNASGNNINQLSQQCQNVIGDVNVEGGDNVAVAQYQYGDIAQEQNIDVDVVQSCFQAAAQANVNVEAPEAPEGAAAQPEAPADDQYAEAPADDQYEAPADDQYEAPADDDAGAAAGAAAPAGEPEAEGDAVSVLPDTGGASLFTLGAGALLVAGGLLARRIVR